MLESLQDLPPGVQGVKAVGKVSREDYERVLEPMLEQAQREHRRVRFLYELGPQFEAFTPSAAWEDAKAGVRFLRLFEGCAVVTDLGWVKESTRFFAFMMPCPMRVFGSQERDQASAWLAALPEPAAVAHRLLPESGVIVVEVTAALRAQDFDAMAVTADQWIASHGELRGLVIHAREFPGWENLGSLLRHVRFVRDHHRKVGRIALAAGSKLAVLVPRVAEHFLKAEVKAFGYDALEDAIAWAAGSPAQGTASPQVHAS